jgi:hypothetical protein
MVWVVMSRGRFVGGRNVKAPVELLPLVKLSERRSPEMLQAHAPHTTFMNIVDGHKLVKFMVKGQYEYIKKSYIFF